MATQAFMSRANSVYYGPSSTIYASVGSVGLGEQVTVYGKEKGWFFIEYSAGSLKKRGYVPYDSIQNPESINEGERYYTGKLDVTNSSTTVYTGPNSSLYATAGSVSSGESVTVYNEVIGSYTYIEYSTSTGTKRGYVLTSRLVGRNIGALAYVVGNTNVFYGPDAANYVTSGSISDSEYFIVLACEKPFGSPEKWCHVEYNTSSGRKRGYIKQDTVIPRGSLSSVSDIRVRRGNAFAIGGLTVYAGPSVYYATAGSISNGELVATLNGEQSESGYTYIEYNTSSGKKRGYVNANYLQETELFSHMMAADAKVYYGPSQKNYAEAGSVKAAEQVSVIGKEKNWFFIEYATATRIKRGYVPATTVMDASIIQQTTPERIYEGHLDMTNSGATVFTGPGEQYATAGSVAATESLTIFNEVVDGYCYVEYSTPNSTKRGYIPVGCLSGKNVGMLGKVIADTVQVYSGPDITYYRCGTVFKDEYVIILNSEGTTIYQDTWYFVEYNTPAGRKRGYVLKASIDPVSSTATLPDLAVGNGLAKALEDMNVFFCPSDQSAIVGSISEDERVSVLVSDNFNPFYSYIEYNSPSGTKRGYVPAAKLISTTVTIPQPNTTIVPVIYGTTANNNTLKYYQIGSGPKTLAVVFAVHGYEDAWAADGEELVRIANHLIEQLENEAATGDLSAWTIYIIPAANPDGITHGWTNNGPGRTTVNDKIDINRCFPTNFTPGTNRRNYTGPSSLGAYEASVLKNLISDWNLNAEYMILLDVHGWLNATYGNPTIGEYFNSQFGFGATISIDSAKGYLSRWAQAYGIKAVLIELPFPSNPQTIIDNNFAGKLSQAVLSILNSDIGYIRPTLLSVGSQGKDVGVLQAYLRYNGFYAGLVTEDFDDLTKEAVLEYQTQHNLTVDGLVGAQTWTEMGFEVNIDGTVDTTCEYYQRYNECADYYQKVQIGCEFIDSGEKYYIRNAYAGLQAAYTPNVANNPDIKLVELDGFDPQKFIITHTFDGYKIASVEDSSKVFTIDASNNTVKLATDIGSKLQRWCIEGDIDSFYVTNIEYPNSRLAVTSSSAGENLIMLNNFYYSIWRFNKITIEREMTPAINQQGVSICYRHDPEINRYDYYLDYTVPILQFLDSKESLCVSMSINTFDAYLLAYLGNETLARAAWWANIAATFTWFFYHVHSGGDWDIKIPEKWDGIFKEPPYDLPYIEFHKGYPNRHKFIFNDELCTTEELGNIMYGYTGTLAGIGDITLYWGGGVANLHSNGSSYPEAMLNPDTKNPNKNYGDRKEDHDAIEKGIALAYERRSNIISIGFNGIPVDELMQDILDEMISIGI